MSLHLESLLFEVVCQPIMRLVFIVGEFRIVSDIQRQLLELVGVVGDCFPGDLLYLFILALGPTSNNDC